LATNQGGELATYFRLAPATTRDLTHGNERFFKASDASDKSTGLILNLNVRERRKQGQVIGSNVDWTHER